jgi:EAL and modified HD-GYP domain-containing signal transduction protein
MPTTGPMPAEALRVAYDNVPEPAGDVLLSRQPVVDGSMRVIGYRVAYATLEGGDAVSSGAGSSARLFGDVISAVGLDELVGSNVAHLPVARDLLVTLGIPPVRPDRVVLRVSYDTASDPDLRSILATLASRGYALSLANLPGPHADLSLLDVFSTVEVDFGSWDELDAAAVVPRILAGHGAPLASGLMNHSDFELAKALGFQLFVGPFFAAPRVASARQVPVGALQGLASIARLQGDAQIEDLEKIIDRDLGLSVKLLRYINSAYFGVRAEIVSIRQAVMMLGSRGVARWALLISLAGGPSTPRELSVLALTRARMCEILGTGNSDIGGDQLFTTGLLSVADALLGLPLEQVVEELPLADEVTQALLWRAGPAGAILDAAVAYERGSFAADSLQGHRRDAGDAYRQALRWAQSTVAEIA